MTENCKWLIGVSVNDPKFYAHLKISTLDELKKAYAVAEKNGSNGKMCKLIARIKRLEKIITRSSNAKDSKSINMPKVQS